MDHSERILDKLESIQEDITEIKQDLAYLKAKSENHTERMNGLETRILSVETAHSKDRTDLAKLKAKNIGAGAGAGGVAAIVTAVIQYLVSGGGS